MVTKILLSTFLFLATQLAWAGEAAVIVLEAPILEKPDLKSKIIQYVRKGDVIYVHNSDLGHGPNELNYNQIEFEDPYYDLEGMMNPTFYRTTTNNGGLGYIYNKHIKVIYGDERERTTKINPYPEHDPTDYRLEEPLAPGYPMYPDAKYRATMVYAIGPQRKINYPYRARMISENFSSNKGGLFSYTRKIPFDEQDRFYFGGIFRYYKGKSEFLLENGFSSKEAKTQVGFGPIFTYDGHRTEKYRISFTGGLSFNWTWAKVAITPDTDINLEERQFSGFSTSARFGSNFAFRNVFPDLDLLVGAELDINFPYSISPTRGVRNPDLWSGADASINYPFGATFLIFLGVQGRY